MTGDRHRYSSATSRAILAPVGPEIAVQLRFKTSRGFQRVAPAYWVPAPPGRWNTWPLPIIRSDLAGTKSPGFPILSTVHSLPLAM